MGTDLIFIKHIPGLTLISDFGLAIALNANSQHNGTDGPPVVNAGNKQDIDVNRLKEWLSGCLHLFINSNMNIASKLLEKYLFFYIWLRSWLD